MSEIRTPSDSRIPSEAEVTALAAEYYEVVQGDIHKDRDCHWRIVERWSYGEHAGWFVEHDGYLADFNAGEPGAVDEQGNYYRGGDQAGFVFDVDRWIPVCNFDGDEVSG